MLRPQLRHLFEDYADAHRHPMNRLTHEIAIPMIVFNTIAMFDWWTWIELSDGRAITSAHAGIAAAGAWYLFMHRGLGLLMIAAMIGCAALGRITPAWLVIAIGLLGWTVQLMGHRLFEKNSPAFMKNMLQALVGPIFFLALITRVWPERAER